jgi:hypothetical protein
MVFPEWVGSTSRPVSADVPLIILSIKTLYLQKTAGLPIPRFNRGKTIAVVGSIFNYSDTPKKVGQNIINFGSKPLLPR